MTLPDPFCPACQQVLAECVCPGEHSLTRERASVEGHRDTPLSPENTPSRRNNQRQRKTRDTGTPTRTLPRTSWTAMELMAATFPPPKWAIPGLMVEGLTVIAGPPKAGKSWLCLDWCVSVSAGGRAMGSIENVEPGECLYLALEDTGRRLQNRLRTILRDQPAPPGLTFATECPPMPLGGLGMISDWISKQHNPRMIIIDVFEKVRGPMRPGESAYTADYNSVGQVKALADQAHVSIGLIFHVRKVSAADFVNEISGTLGVGGAADTIAVLRRNRGEWDGQLLITGRDVEENEYAVKFAPELGAWQLLGLASEHGMADTRTKILGYLREHGSGRPKSIALGTGLDYELVKKTCSRMVDDQQLDTDNRGTYLPPRPMPVPDTPP